MSRVGFHVVVLIAVGALVGCADEGSSGGSGGDIANSKALSSL